MIVIGRIRNSFAARCIVFCILIFVAPTMVLFSVLQREAQVLSCQEAANFLLTNLKNVAAKYDKLMRNANLYHLQPLNNEVFQAATIEPELLRRIRASLISGESPNGEFFALKNILDQLRLYYGAGASVTIDSSVGQGTSVTMIIPLESGCADDV